MFKHKKTPTETNPFGTAQMFRNLNINGAPISSEVKSPENQNILLPIINLPENKELHLSALMVPVFTQDRASLYQGYIQQARMELADQLHSLEQQKKIDPNYYQNILNNFDTWEILASDLDKIINEHLPAKSQEISNAAFTAATSRLFARIKLIQERLGSSADTKSNSLYDETKKILDLEKEDDLAIIQKKLADWQLDKFININLHNPAIPLPSSSKNFLEEEDSLSEGSDNQEAIDFIKRSTEPVDQTEEKKEEEKDKDKDYSSHEISTPELRSYNGSDTQKTRLSLSEQKLDEICIQCNNDPFEAIKKIMMAFQSEYRNLLIKQEVKVEAENYEPQIKNRKDGFVHNLFLAITRSYNQRLVIAKQIGIKKESQEKIQLHHIAMTHSDLHKKGQQVLILYFSINALDREQKFSPIVYKPSSIVVDDYLLGSRDASSSSKPPSVVGILNKYYTEAGKKPLRTYSFIIGNTSIKNGYGFIEYLPHKPWPDIDITKETYMLLNEFHLYLMQKKNPIVLSQFLKDKLNVQYESLPEHYVNLIMNIKDLSSYFQAKFDCELYKLYKTNKDNGKENDFVLETKEEQDQYSYDCGCITAIAYIYRIGDLHLENWLSTGKRAVPIDIECAFQTVVDSINGTAILGALGGARPDAFSSPKFQLLDSSHHYTVEMVVRKVEKNCVYQFCDVRKCLLPFKINPDQFSAGIRHILQVIMNNKNHFIRSLVKCSDNIVTRVVPYKTNDWKEWMNDESRRKIQESSDRRKWFNPQLNRERGSPKFVLLSKQATCEALAIENVPVFYNRITKSFLTDEQGKIIKLNQSEVCGIDKEDMQVSKKYLIQWQGIVDTQQSDISYYPKPPIEYVILNIKLLSTSENIEKIIEMARNLLANSSSLRDSPENSKFSSPAPSLQNDRLNENTSPTFKQ